MARPISAADLRLSADPERYAAAMARCRGSHECGEKGFCMRGGECFTGTAPAPDKVSFDLATLGQDLEELRGQLLDLRAEVKELRQELVTRNRRRAKKTPPKISEIR